MAIPINYQPPPQTADKPPIVQFVTREDVLWNRPVFRAPPLRVTPPAIDSAAFKLGQKSNSSTTRS